MRLTLLAALLAPATALAEVDPKCADLEQPANYDEQVQQDFLQNYIALSTTLSAVHAPVPHKPGHGAISLDVGIIPPLGCEKRYVLNWTKTEETNKSPVVPRPRVTFSLPVGEMKALVPYAGVAYVPPVPLAGTRNVIVSAEAGLGVRIKDSDLQLGGRFHATSAKIIADAATAFDPSDPPVDDLFLAYTLGVDAMVGYAFGEVVPYGAVGFTDASTFFFIGDDGVVTNNYHPYAGLSFSLGLDALIADWFRLGAEFYGAPGGYSLPDDTVSSVEKGARYGHLYTGRLRLGVEL